MRAVGVLRRFGTRRSAVVFGFSFLEGSGRSEMQPYTVVHDFGEVGG